MSEAFRAADKNSLIYITILLGCSARSHRSNRVPQRSCGRLCLDICWGATQENIIGRNPLYNSLCHNFHAAAYVYSNYWLKLSELKSRQS
jgi:hypothetical protein